MRGIRPALAPAAAVRHCSSPVVAATPLSAAPSKDPATIGTGSSGSFQQRVRRHAHAQYLQPGCNLASIEVLTQSELHLAGLTRGGVGLVAGPGRQ